MKEIPLGKDYIAFVDDEDYERVSQFRLDGGYVQYRDEICRSLRASQGKSAAERANGKHALTQQRPASHRKI